MERAVRPRRLVGHNRAPAAATKETNSRQPCLQPEAVPSQRALSNTRDRQEMLSYRALTLPQDDRLNIYIC
jgi:hypothetical protein